MSHDLEFSGELPPLAVRRILKEWKMLETDPLHDQGIYHSFDESLRNAAVLIIGPIGTPYAHGFYLFEFTFPNSYPAEPPRVHFQNGDWRVRFNPNLWKSGKVCLSILGTWPGPSWTSSSSLRTSVIFLRSLLCSRLLRNEPGYEEECDEEGNVYAVMLRYENVAASLTQLTQPLPVLFKPLRDKMVESFKHNFHALAFSLDEFQRREGDFDYCSIFDVTTHYTPAKLQRDLRELFRTIVSAEDAVMYQPCLEALPSAMACLEVPDMEARLPPTVGLEGLVKAAYERRWSSVSDKHIVPDEFEGLPPCQGLRNRTQQLAREVVAAAVDKAILVLMDARQSRWMIVDTALCPDQGEGMLPLSKGLPKQEARVAAKVVAGVVARALARIPEPEPTGIGCDQARLGDKWSSMDTELAEFCSDCPICFDQINRPVVLPCRHSFCADCLLRAITQYQESSCPLCRGVLCSEVVGQHYDPVQNQSDDEFFEDEFEPDQGNHEPTHVEGRSLAYRAVWYVYMAPAAMYGCVASVPLFLYLAPYIVYHELERRAWREQREAETDDLAAAYEGEVSISDANGYTQLPGDQVSGCEDIKRSCQPRASLIPPLR